MLTAEDRNYLHNETDSTIREAYTYLVNAEQHFGVLKAVPVPEWGEMPDSATSVVRRDLCESLGSIWTGAERWASTLTGALWMSVDARGRAADLAVMLRDLAAVVREKHESVL